VSRAMGMGRRLVPPLDCGSDSAGTEPRVQFTARCEGGRVSDCGLSRGQSAHVILSSFRPEE
jgi:hypothetical protein